jgi:hypothetical protein
MLRCYYECLPYIPLAYARSMRRTTQFGIGGFTHRPDPALERSTSDGEMWRTISGGSLGLELLEFHAGEFRLVNQGNRGSGDSDVIAQRKEDRATFQTTADCTCKTRFRPDSIFLSGILQ